VLLGWRSRGKELSPLLVNSLIVQSVLIVGGFLPASIIEGRSNLYYPHFGILGMFFGVAAFGLQVSQGKPAALERKS